MNLSTAQRQMLVTLDGNFSPEPFPGTAIRTAEALRMRGFVTYRVERYSIVTGTFPYTRQGKRVRVSLTKAGSDFIWSGGIDH